MNLRSSFLAVWIALAAGSAGADVELRLVNGEVLRGADVQREGGNYFLEIEPGRVVSIPVELVDEVRLEEKREDEPPTGLTEAEPEALAGSKTPAPGLRVREPEVLAGVPVDPPRTADQLAALGETATFQRDIVDSRWRPSSDWRNDPGQNEFAPSTWAKGPIDSQWTPQSAFPSRDALESGRAGWQESIIDPGWAPRDGFRSGD